MADRLRAEHGPACPQLASTDARVWCHFRCHSAPLRGAQAKRLRSSDRRKPLMFFNLRKRRARDSNPQPLAGHLISNQAASHSRTLLTICRGRVMYSLPWQGATTVRRPAVRGGGGRDVFSLPPLRTFPPWVETVLAKTFCRHAICDLGLLWQRCRFSGTNTSW